MRLIVTGGGTGGHVYPALEVARYAQIQGAELFYLGSLRGQEVKAAAAKGIPYQGFPSEPLYSIKTPQGFKAAWMLLKSTLMATQYLRSNRPDVIFSTGGYSGAPIMLAARSLKIPYCVHACDTVPGRAIRMVAKSAAQFTCTFRNTAKHAGREVVRTGQPIRDSLRQGLSQTNPDNQFVVTLGGSQGSGYLNDLVPNAAKRNPGARFLISTGPSHIDSVTKNIQGVENVTAKGFLEPDQMVAAYKTATIAIARSGGTIAEFALARLPSILVPWINAADNHQYHNAMEFVEMGAATLFPQSDPAQPDEDARKLAAQISEWLADPEKIQRAKVALSEWDIPDATARIYNLVKQAAER